MINVPSLGYINVSIEGTDQDGKSNYSAVWISLVESSGPGVGIGTYKQTGTILHPRHAVVGLPS